MKVHIKIEHDGKEAATWCDVSAAPEHKDTSRDLMREFFAHQCAMTLAIMHGDIAMDGITMKTTGTSGL